MAQLSESVSASDEGFAGCYRVPDHLEAGHLDGHSELNRKTNRLEIEENGSSDNIILGDPSVLNDIAADVFASAVLGGGTNTQENIVGGDGSSTVGTETSNTVTASTEASYSVIVGGYDNVVGSISSAILGGTHNYVAVGTTHGTILGHNNKIDNGTFCLISGGNGNTIDDSGGADPNYANIAGGSGNTASNVQAVVSGGSNNVASGNSSVVGGGANNTASGANASVQGGASNVASGTYGTVPGGFGNEAATKYSVALGLYAKPVAQMGAVSIASGRFAATGDAQTTTLIVKATTSNNSGTNLLGSEGGLLVIPTDTTWGFVIHIAARRTDADGESAFYEIKGCIDNNNGSTALVGSISKAVIAEDTAAWDVTAVAYDDGDALLIQVTGENSKTINWVGRVELTEVTG